MKTCHPATRQLLADAFTAALSASAAAVDYTWTGGSGSWSTGSLWEPSGVPDASDVNVYIDGAKTGIASFVTLAGSRDVASVALDFGDTLSIANGAILNIHGALANSGRVDLIGGVAVLRVANNTTFSGSGSVVLGGNGDNHIQSMFGQPGNRLVNAAGHTIEGAGNIGGSNMKLTNQGLIVANNAIALVVDPINTADGFYNRGTVRVDATRTMTFAAGSTLLQDSAAARTEVHGTLNVPLLDLQAGLLAGSGTVVGAVQNAGGIVAPGASPGSLTVGTFTQAAAGTLAIELEHIGIHDLLLVNGSADLGGTLALSCFSACSFAVGDEFVILDATGNLSGIFGSGVMLRGFATGAFDVVYDYTLDEVRLKVTQTVTPVPEPATWAMMLAAPGLIGCATRRIK